MESKNYLCRLCGRESEIEATFRREGSVSPLWGTSALLPKLPLCGDIARSCKEPQAEDVRNKEGANFCDFFRLAEGRAALDRRDEAAQAGAQFESLFRKGPGQGAALQMKMKEEVRIREILDRLEKEYQGLKLALNFQNPLQLLMATILSAQCTDERVNAVIPGLFKKYPTAESFAKAGLAKLEEDIRPTGFFHNKAKAIIGCSKQIVESFGGKVPDRLDDLVNCLGWAERQPTSCSLMPLGSKPSRWIPTSFGFPAVWA